MVLVSAAGVLGISATPATAGAAGARVGRAPLIPAGAVAGPALASDTVLHVDVALQPRDPAALTAYAQAVSTPGSALYRHDVTPAQFANRFGPTPTALRTVRRALVAAGLDPGAVTANRLSIPVRATAAQLGTAFSVSFAQFALPGGRVAYANTSAPRFAASAAPFVQAVVGLDDLTVETPAGTGAPATGPRPGIGPQPATGGPQPCPAAKTDASENGGFTADQLAAAYGLSSSYGAGDLGAGQTVALVEYESDLPSDVAAYQSCYGTSTPVNYETIDGGPKKGAGGGEAALDIEDIIGLAPQVSILVYQAPDTSAAALDLLNAIVSQDVAKVISNSWVLCEQYEGSGATAENTIFEEAAVQGQSFLSASGDYGSQACRQFSHTNNTLAVDDPASQPFVTGVGGTTLSAVGPPPSETVWNNGIGNSGGGGLSTDWAMPSYQSDAAPPVGTVNAYSSGTPCGAVGGDCREVPDVSGDAVGYVIYWDGGWTESGGTSAATPTWASLVALTNASTDCAGSTVGFANPLLYDVAGTDPGAFNDITVGDNDDSGLQGGLYPSLSGYDLASGLGSPNGAVLSGDLCAAGTTADPVTVTNPGSQSTDVGQSASLQIAATDATIGQSLTYRAFGLPTGLSIASSSGLITGVPTASGVFDPVVSAEDGNGASDAVTFSWSVPSSVTKLSPAHGPAKGGTKVKINGVGFRGATSVLFGGTSVPATKFKVNRGGTKITVHAPAGTGSIDVRVVGPAGTSPVTAATVYTYTG
ncbi:MAG TPA: protease pro-enzyme activation domain-containing protein [Acidimicrobiales bacterium]|nr:protease pro-enzyme activation domain-containing protein [Acidimicrobiales bacterium]